ncbi:MAG: transglutaminase domain-containing protein [Candidatus Heteroscillospira sp.]|jgi:hypothetical protein
MQEQYGFSFQIAGEAGGTPGRILAASLLFLGMFACFWGGLGLDLTGCAPLPLALAGLIYCAAACRLPRRALAFQIAAAAILALYTLLVSRYIISGWNVTMNAVFSVLEKRLGYIFPRYEAVAAALPPSVCAGLFLALPSVLLGLLAAKTVCGGRLWLLPSAVLLCALCAMGVSNLYPPDWSWVLLALGLAIFSVQRLGKWSVAPGLRQVAVHIMLFALVMALSYALAALGNENGVVRAMDNRRAAEREIHRMKYEDEYTTLPEGNFQGLSAFSPDSTTALTIEAEEPEELYLRGYVGEKYTGSGWSDLEPERRAEYAQLFSWLHQRGFYGQTQYALLCRALGENKKENKLSIDVEDACTAWRYAPYSLTDAGADPRRIGDADLPSRGAHGEGEYTILTGGTPISEYERLADKLTAARKAGSPAALDYLASENAYRKFVYDCYLDIPEEAREALAQVFAELELPDGRVSFSDAQMVVRAYLSSIVTYQEEPQLIQAGEDFVSGFLLDTKEGYSVHYATAAALMFRYLGIPARYVEGWFLPQEAAEEMEPGEPAELEQDFAHAWVEVYRDGVGFVPFEITPPYTDPMQQSDMTQGGSGGAAIPPEEEPEPLTPVRLALAAIALLIMLLALILAVVLRRMWRRKKLRALLEAKDSSTAVSNMTTWSVKLLGCMGIRYAGGSLKALVPEIERNLGPELAERYRKVLTLQQRALFSETGVTDGERAEPMELLEELEQTLRRRGSRTERFRLRWIECVI